MRNKYVYVLLTICILVIVGLAIWLVVNPKNTKNQSNSQHSTQSTTVSSSEVVKPTVPTNTTLSTPSTNISTPQLKIEGTVSVPQDTLPSVPTVPNSESTNSTIDPQKFFEENKPANPQTTTTLPVNNVVTETTSNPQNFFNPPAPASPPPTDPSVVNNVPSDPIYPEIHIDSIYTEPKNLDVDVCKSFKEKDLGGVITNINTSELKSTGAGNCYFLPQNLDETSGSVELFPANSNWVNKVYGSAQTKSIEVPGFKSAKVIVPPATKEYPNQVVTVIAENDKYTAIIVASNAKAGVDATYKDAIKMVSGTGNWLNENQPDPKKLAAAPQLPPNVIVDTTSPTKSSNTQEVKNGQKSTISAVMVISPLIILAVLSLVGIYRKQKHS